MPQFFMENVKKYTKKLNLVEMVGGETWETRNVDRAGGE